MIGADRQLHSKPQSMSTLPSNDAELIHIRHHPKLLFRAADHPYAHLLGASLATGEHQITVWLHFDSVLGRERCVGALPYRGLRLR